MYTLMTVANAIACDKHVHITAMCWQWFLLASSQQIMTENWMQDMRACQTMRWNFPERAQECTNSTCRYSIHYTSCLTSGEIHKLSMLSISYCHYFSSVYFFLAIFEYIILLEFETRPDTITFPFFFLKKNPNSFQWHAIPVARCANTKTYHNITRKK